MRPAELPGGLKAALVRLAERTEGVIRVQLEAHPPPGLLPEHAETLYRAAQEGVHNALKHARAAQLRLRCGAVLGGVRLSVEDDGVGLLEPLTEGFGLRSLRGRAEALGGTLSLTSTAKGTWLELVLPSDQPL